MDKPLEEQRDIHRLEQHKFNAKEKIKMDRLKTIVLALVNMEKHKKYIGRITKMCIYFGALGLVKGDLPEQIIQDLIRFKRLRKEHNE